MEDLEFNTTTTQKQKKTVTRRGRYKKTEEKPEYAGKGKTVREIQKYGQQKLVPIDSRVAVTNLYPNLYGHRRKRFSSPEEIEDGAIEYVNMCTTVTIDEDNNLISKEITRPLTWAGLATHFGVTTTTLDNVIEGRKGYGTEMQEAMRYAKQILEVYANEQLFLKTNTAGVQFYLKNIFKDKYSDTQRFETGNENTKIDYSKLSSEELASLRQIQEKLMLNE